MNYNIMSPSSSTKEFQDGARSGLIPSATRLSYAIQYFAGGSVYDIAVTNGVSVSSVFISVYRVVDTVNNTCEFDIIFPDHCAKENISKRFKKKSKA